MAVLFLGEDRMPLVADHGAVLIAHSLEIALALKRVAGVPTVNTGYLEFRQSSILSPYWMMARERLEFVPPNWMHSLRVAAVSLGEPDAVRVLRELCACAVPDSVSREARTLRHNAGRLLKAEARLGHVVVMEPELPPGVRIVTDHRQRKVRIRK